MSTATVTVGSKKYVEITQPELFKFIAEGQTLGGVLRGIHEVNLGGDDTLEYLIEKDGGQMVKLRTTADLSQKITPALKGRHLLITYIGEDKNVGLDKGNAMKKYKVLAEAAPAANAHGLTIGDDDLPPSMR